MAIVARLVVAVAMVVSLPGAPLGTVVGFDSSGAGIVRAASPSPSPPIGDPRSPGQGAGFVGEPLAAIGLVLLVGILSVVVTLLYVRLAAEDSGGRRR